MSAVRRVCRAFLLLSAIVLALSFSQWLVQHNVFVAPIGENDDSSLVASYDGEKKEPASIVPDMVLPDLVRVNFHSAFLCLAIISFISVFLGYRPNLSPRSPPPAS